MKAIKLFLLETLKDGTKRLQSQLPYFYKHKSADFIIKNGKLYNWGYGKGGESMWIEKDIPYKIVTDGKEMLTQTINL